MSLRGGAERSTDRTFLTSPGRLEPHGRFSRCQAAESGRVGPRGRFLLIRTRFVGFRQFCTVRMEDYRLLWICSEHRYGHPLLSRVTYEGDGNRIRSSRCWNYVGRQGWRINPSSRVMMHQLEEINDDLAGWMLDPCGVKNERNSIWEPAKRSHGHGKSRSEYDDAKCDL